MSDAPIIVTDFNFSSATAGDAIFGSSIKNETLSNDCFMLSPEEMYAFTNEPNNYHILQDANQHDSKNVPNVPNLDNQVDILFQDEKFAMNMEEFNAFNETKNENCIFKLKERGGKLIKVWECKICYKEFGHQYTLMRHIPTHTDERKFQCNTCGKAFRQMSTLSQHRAIHSTDRPYKCDECHKTFNRVSTLISHRKTHTGVKPHCCHVCNKAFHQKGNLRNHVYTHTNERPYKCDVCFKGFNQMSNLMCHKVKAHQRVDKPRYICQICNEEFPKRVSLRNHEQYQHGALNTDHVASSSSPPLTKYNDGVLVNPINTAAMQHAIATNQSPFALLRPLYGIPVLVRVLAAGDKQMLMPATAEDLKKHGKITMHPQVSDDTKTEPEDKDSLPENENHIEEHEVNVIGTTVQIKIPIVATVVQKCGLDGNMSVLIESPGPNSSDGLNDNYYVTSATNEDGEYSNNADCDSSYQHDINDTEDTKPLIDDNSENTFFGTDYSSSHVDLYSTVNEINLQASEVDILQQIEKEDGLNISFGETIQEEIFVEMDKPRMISLCDNENVVCKDVENYIL